jgi:hypothetical protein
MATINSAIARIARAGAAALTQTGLPIIAVDERFSLILLSRRGGKLHRWCHADYDVTGQQIQSGSGLINTYGGDRLRAKKVDNETTTYYC